MPILFSTFNSSVWFLRDFFETILTFHLTTGQYKEQTTAAKSHKTKETREKEQGNSLLLRDFFKREGHKDFIFHSREHFSDIATHNENLVFY